MLAEEQETAVGNGEMGGGWGRVAVGAGKFGRVLVKRGVPSGSSPGCGRHCRQSIETKEGFTGVYEVSGTTTGMREFTSLRGALFLIVIFNFMNIDFDFGVCHVTETCRCRKRQHATARQRSSLVGTHRRGVKGTGGVMEAGRSTHRPRGSGWQ